MINHRGPEFAAMLDRILTGHEAVLRDDRATSRCSRPPARAGSRRPSSTRCRRATASSACRSASFGDRFAKIAGIYGADVTKLDVEWGQAADPDAVRERARGGPGVQGRAADPQRDLDRGDEPDRRSWPRPSATSRPDALILVDSVSGLGAVPFEMDAWGVDVVVTGSQKAWMAAPGPGDDRGLASAAWAAMETATMPRFYLDLRAPPRRGTPTARRRSRRRSRSSTRSTRASA